MRLVDIKNKVLFALLVLGMAFNILWSMRLETRADKLGTIVDEYHDRLMQLEDSFPVPLEKFSRTARGITLQSDSTRILSDDIMFETKEQGGNKVYLSSDRNIGFWVDVEDSVLNLHPEYATLRHQMPGVLDRNQINIDDISIELDARETRILSDDIELKTKKEGGNRIWLSSDPNIGLWVEVGDFVLNLRPEYTNLTYSASKGSSVCEITLDVEGIELKQSDTGTFSLAKGQGIDISAKKTNPMKIRGENDLKIAFDGDIDIKAKGNINILSENGQIKINGKEIHLNE